MFEKIKEKCCFAYVFGDSFAANETQIKQYDCNEKDKFLVLGLLNKVQEIPCPLGTCDPRPQTYSASLSFCMNEVCPNVKNYTLRK